MKPFIQLILTTLLILGSSHNIALVSPQLTAEGEVDIQAKTGEVLFGTSTDVDYASLEE